MQSQCNVNEKDGRGNEFSAADASRLSMEDGTTPGRPDPVREFKDSVKAVTDALTAFGQTRIEAARVHAQDVLLKAVLGIVGGIAGLVFVIVSIVLLMEGLAGGVSRLFNAAPWVGYLIVGAVCVGGPTAFLLIKVKRTKAKLLKGLKEKYAGRREIQCQK